MTSQRRADRGDKRVAASRARRYVTGGLVAGAVWFAVLSTGPLQSQAAGPTVLDPDLAVATVVSGLVAADRHGVHRATTTSSSWKRRQARCSGSSTAWCRPRRHWISPSTPRPNGACSGSRFIRASRAIPVSICIWTESTAMDAAGAPVDTADLASTPLLGNRVDSFIWNGTALRFERNLIRLRAFQADAGQPLRGNHNGGIIRFEMSRDDDRGDRDHGDDDRGDDRDASSRRAAMAIATDDDGATIAATTTGTRPGCSSSSATTAAAGRRRTSRTGRLVRGFRTTSSAGRSRTTPTSPASFCASTTTARRRATIRSSSSAAGSEARSARTSRRSSPTASATASGWPSTPAPACCGTRRTATTRSTRSIASRPVRTTDGCR